jgi:naphthalene 1,2-dioxygenase system ferredoxin subunit
MDSDTYTMTLRKRRIASIDDVPEGEMIAVNADGRKLALYHLETGEFCVTDNVCTHEFALLTDGCLEGYEIECPLHAGRYDIRSGKGLCTPIERDLGTYLVEVHDGDIYVLVPDVSE